MLWLSVLVHLVSVNGSSHSRVQFQVHSSRYTACAENLTTQLSNLLCRHLGYRWEQSNICNVWQQERLVVCASCMGFLESDFWRVRRKCETGDKWSMCKCVGQSQNDRIQLGNIREIIACVCPIKSHWISSVFVFINDVFQVRKRPTCPCLSPGFPLRHSAK